MKAVTSKDHAEQNREPERDAPVRQDREHLAPNPHGSGYQQKDCAGEDGNRTGHPPETGCLAGEPEK